ncbi:hypothetical protein DD559_19360 [Sphingomonas pokkalii]|uniref:Uncharacterized protein n=1 Tax=Sphingomonas pokkalii TaxID=2175090 RepID=A0A2U0S976_9SPHN|nr:hypothetical protein DD559_19360 [Sphingomonas pokkalii]
MTSLTRSRYLALPFVVTSTYWVLDHLLPDILPKPPKPVSWSIVACAASLLLIALIVMGWRRLVDWMPRPWFPSPFWRVASWLRCRPTVSVVTVIPQASIVDGRMEECVIHVTLVRSLAQMPVDAVVRFDATTLILQRTDQRGSTRHVFRPKETGGFLMRPIAAGSLDSILIDFAATGLPARFPDAPDFDGDYEIAITGIRVEARSDRPFGGKLPPVKWQMCRAAYQANLSAPLSGNAAF